MTPLPPLSSASSSSMDPAKGAPSQPGAPEGLGLRPKRSWVGLRGIHMSLEQENSLWGSGEAIGIQVPGLVLPAQDRRGKDGPGGGHRSRRKGSAPTSSIPTPRCPAPEPRPALGKLEGGRMRRSCGRDRKNPGRTLAACSNSSRPLVTGRLGGMESWAPERPGSLQV